MLVKMWPSLNIFNKGCPSLNEGYNFEKETKQTILTFERNTSSLIFK